MEMYFFLVMGFIISVPFLLESNNLLVLAVSL